MKGFNYKSFPYTVRWLCLSADNLLENWWMLFAFATCVHKFRQWIKEAIVFIWIHLYLLFSYCFNIYHNEWPAYLIVFVLYFVRILAAGTKWYWCLNILNKDIEFIWCICVVIRTMITNGWCFRPQSCTVRLYWADDNLGYWDEFYYESCPWCRI